MIRMISMSINKLADQKHRLKELFKRIWSTDTCYPGSKDEWSVENPSLGQCAVTSLLINEIFGGKILFNKEYHHYWNLLEDGSEIDLTKDQFGAQAQIKAEGEASRDYILYSENAKRSETLKRYKILKKRFEKLFFIESIV